LSAIRAATKSQRHPIKNACTTAPNIMRYIVIVGPADTPKIDVTTTILGPEKRYTIETRTGISKAKTRSSKTAHKIGNKYFFFMDV
jgi:hypothetical protein